MAVQMVEIQILNSFRYSLSVHFTKNYPDHVITGSGDNTYCSNLRNGYKHSALHETDNYELWMWHLHVNNIFLRNQPVTEKHEWLHVGN